MLRDPLHRLNLIFPLILFALAAVDFLFLFPLPGGVRSVYHLAGVLAFTGGHVGWTFVMLLYMPEAREWIHTQSEGNPSRFWRQNLLVFAATFVFTFAALKASLLLGTS